MTVLDSRALASQWAAAAAAQFAGILLLIFVLSQGAAFHGAVGRGAWLRRRLILHRCISRLKLDNSSTRLGYRSPVSLLSLDVFSRAPFRGYEYAALTCQLLCSVLSILGWFGWTTRMLLKLLKRLTIKNLGFCMTIDSTEKNRTQCFRTLITIVLGTSKNLFRGSDCKYLKKCSIISKNNRISFFQVLKLVTTARISGMSLK